jgi:hypothetical protein
MMGERIGPKKRLKACSGIKSVKGKKKKMERELTDSRRDWGTEQLLFL